MVMSDGVILLVEDNPDDVFATRRAFGRSKVTNELVVAMDGQAALDLLLPAQGTQPLQPVLVLLDLNLPKIGGLEILQRLRGDPRTEFLPVVVLTSSESDEDWICAHRGGANAFVRKPVLFGDLHKAVGFLGLFWTMVNRSAPQLNPIPVGQR
jgi:two-component system response regulator